ncbi:MAG: hypothetical protein J6K43_04545 [Lachnospiraceae bacterium]|nr:hypothetical protein [Lachnospiraceae bacterium]
MVTVASAFITWANPREIIEYEHDVHGEIVFNEDGSKKILSSTPSFLAELTEQEICDLVLKMWCDSKPGRVGAVTYCVSETGFHHLHMVLEVTDSHSDRFSYVAVQKIYGRKFHIEPTRGSKTDAMDYINKTGKYAEKGEVVLAKAIQGEIQGNKGNRTDLAGIGEMIEQGMTPNQIMDKSISFRRYEKLIRDSYFRKRDLETDFVRPVKVFYHVGESGTGKTFGASVQVEKLGSDKVYFCSDYENGFLDGYNGEEILWLDEYRGQLKYATFLSILDKYKTRIHARYSDVLMLWNEVHITSVLPPEAIYDNMINSSRYKKLDTYAQLKRRIFRVIYHYIDTNGNYCQYGIDMTEYKDYETLKGLAHGTCDKHGFITVPDSDNPFLQ